MEVTLTWDEGKLAKVVKEAREARRRVKSVAWALVVVGLLAPALLTSGFRDGDRQSICVATPPAATAPGMPAPYLSPPPPIPVHPQPSHKATEGWGGGLFFPMFWIALALLSWPPWRPVAWVMSLLGVLLGLVGLANLVLEGLDLLIWHSGTEATLATLVGCGLLALAGVIQLHCAVVLNRGSSIFACDYVKGEVTDWSVILGLLQAEGPGYQELREQVGLR